MASMNDQFSDAEMKAIRGALFRWVMHCTFAAPPGATLKEVRKAIGLPTSVIDYLLGNDEPLRPSLEGLRHEGDASGDR